MIEFALCCQSELVGWFSFDQLVEFEIWFYECSWSDFELSDRQALFSKSINVTKQA